MLGIGPIKGQAYCFAAKMFRNGENVYRVNPDFAAGDFKVETWDYTTDFPAWAEGSGTVANLTALPKKINAASSTFLIYLTAAEMSHDVVIITAADQDGLNNSWGNNCWVIYPDSRKTDIASLLASFTAIKGATFNTTTDSLEAIRDRGDVAWIGGGVGGGDATAANQLEIIAAIAALNNISVADIMADVVEGTMTIKQALRVLLAVMAGKTSGGGTSTVTIRDTGDVKNRVVATVDGNGNRTAVTMDVS